MVQTWTFEREDTVNNRVRSLGTQAAEAGESKAQGHVKIKLKEMLGMCLIAREHA